jgi:hypothetical protein
VARAVVVTGAARGSTYRPGKGGGGWWPVRRPASGAEHLNGARVAERRRGRQGRGDVTARARGAGAVRAQGGCGRGAAASGAANDGQRGGRAVARVCRGRARARARGSRARAVLTVHVSVS